MKKFLGIIGVLGLLALLFSFTTEKKKDIFIPVLPPTGGTDGSGKPKPTGKPVMVIPKQFANGFTKDNVKDNRYQLPLVQPDYANSTSQLGTVGGRNNHMI